MNNKKIKKRVVYDQLDSINIIIESKGYGKTYHELNRFIKSKLLKDKKSFEKQMRDLELIDNEDCIAYKRYETLICYIDNLINFLEDKNK